MRPCRRLMLVTDRNRTAGRDLVDCVCRAVEGGVGWVQLREKDLDTPDLDRLAERLRRAVPPGVTLSVNGDAAVAACHGWGLHLPAATPPLPGGAADRQLLGRSIHDAREARAAAAEGVDYVILGTIFATSSKPGLPGRGPGVIGELLPLLESQRVFAIGGIDASNLHRVLAQGAFGVAVCRAILEAPDPRTAASEIVEAIHGSRKKQPADVQ